MIATLSAVLSLRQDSTTIVSFGKSKIIGNTLGGTLAIIYFFVKSYFYNDFLMELILLPILVVIVTVVSDGISNSSGIIPAVATLLPIALSTPQGESALCTVQRVLDTSIGASIAIDINLFLHPPETEKKEELLKDLVEFQKKERLLRASSQKIEAEVQKWGKNNENRSSFEIT